MCVSMCKNRVFRGIVPVKDSCRQRSTHNDRGQAPRLSVNTVRTHGGSDRFGWLCVQVTVLRCAELVPADWSYSKKAYVSSDPYVKLQVIALGIDFHLDSHEECMGEGGSLY